jgi:hypothetical protein
MKVKAYLTSLETPDLSRSPNLSVSRSLPKLELLRKGLDHRFTKSIASHSLLPQSLTEIDEVASLSQWPRKSEGNKQTHTDLAQFQERFSDIERVIGERKGKFVLPPLSSFSERNSMDISMRRAEKVNQEQEFQVKVSYSRHYEEELLITEQTTNALLHSLKAQREALRKHNTFIRTQLMLAELRDKEEATSSFGSVKDLRHLFKSTSTLRPRNFANLPKFKTQMNCTEETREGFGENQEKALAEIFKNSKKAKELDELVKKTRDQLKTIRNTQINHYYAILQAGKDTRTEGLLWVVKAIWSKGQKTALERFPRFLDSTTIATILELAELSREIDQIRAQIEDLNKSKKGVLVFARSHPDKWNGVHKRLESLGKTTFSTNKLTAETLPETQQPLSRFESLHSIEGESIEDKTRTLEKECQQLEELMSFIRLNEQKRLLHECCFNKLEKRLGASMKEMLATVVGLEVVKRQASILAKEQIVLAESQRRIKTYRLGRRRSQE